MTRVEETPVTNKLLPNEQARLPELQRQQQLLHHLCTGQLNDVPNELLLEPRSDTRPSVRLVSYYPMLQQMVVGNFSPIDVVKLVPSTFLVLVALQVERLESWLLTAVAASWLRDVVQLVLEPVVWFAVAAVVFLAIANLRGRWSWTRNLLTLDLNELRVAMPDRLRQVPWCGIYTASRGILGWVRVELEDGMVVLLRVPKADRDMLIDIMRGLIRLHHRNLYGQAPDPGSSNPQPVPPAHGEAEETL